MSDTWAAVLAISVAVMALVQVGYVVVLAIAGRKLLTAVATTQQQVEALATDVKDRVGAVTERVNAVADDVRAVTSRVQQVASSVADGVQRVEDQVKAAGQRVQATVDRVPPGVKINTTPTNYSPVSQLQLMRIKGESWDLFGPVIGAVALLVLDDYTEAIPAPVTTTGVSFGFDAPGARPPQSILLCVPPVIDTAWSVDMLAGVIGETLDLAKIRMVDLSAVAWAGRFVPTIYLTDSDIASGLDLPVRDLVKNAYTEMMSRQP